MCHASCIAVFAPACSLRASHLIVHVYVQPFDADPGSTLGALQPHAPIYSATHIPFSHTPSQPVMLQVLELGGEAFKGLLGRSIFQGVRAYVVLLCVTV